MSATLGISCFAFATLMLMTDAFQSEPSVSKISQNIFLHIYLPDTFTVYDNRLQIIEAILIQEPTSTINYQNIGFQRTLKLS